MPKVECWFDGAAWPNPGGRGGFGALMKVDGRLTWSAYGYIGKGPQISNNVAEYAGCIEVMRQLVQLQISEAIIYGDSEMVIRQMSGRGRKFNKSALYYPYYLVARDYRPKLPNIQFQWIPREQNEKADELSNRGLNDKVIHPVLTLDIEKIFADASGKKSERPNFLNRPEMDSASNAVVELHNRLLF